MTTDRHEPGHRIAEKAVPMPDQSNPEQGMPTSSSSSASERGTGVDTDGEATVPVEVPSSKTATRAPTAPGAPPTQPPRPAYQQTGPGRKERSESRAAFVFLLPWLLGLVFITIGPILASLYLSFTDYSLLQPPNWIGFDNYERLFQHDPRFMTSVGVTLRYVFISVPLQLAFALFLAVILDRGVRGLPLYRSLYYLPSLIGTSVAIAILWRRVFGAEGLFNTFIELFGFQGREWIANPDTALGTLIVLNIWTFGSPMVIFLAALRQIPQEFIEAASVDGAGPFARFFRIKLPLLTPVIFFNLVLQTIFSFQAFTPAFVVSGGTGGPADATLFYTLYLYMEGFANLRMGYASALAWVMLITVGVVTALNFLVSKYWVFYQDKP